MWGLIGGAAIGLVSYFGGFFSGVDTATPAVVISGNPTASSSSFNILGFELNKVSTIVWSVIILFVFWLVLKVSGEFKRLIK
ncbi:MAG: hypothetical protein PQ612_06440 [Rickettsiales bacterium]|nr:hypothetical protein [Pseudomonadota bacterium]MDA0966611.1 hypothetical protein [Pseudomonadota bacterium]MDG4543639.1 hypothetical protein [Rickettsiales bacterium]MDG4545786.1 hypothetical protein [Rickettsiales bacterium]MDG4547440.1 hypothetical protein [Rickettsiales bacterium]